MDSEQRMRGDDLRRARKRRGLGVREVADLAGISPETLSGIERERRYPTLHTLERLADVLQIRFVIRPRETEIELE